MASWDDVARLALTLPETAESTSYGSAAWTVRGKSFVWERPLRKSDLAALGADAPAEGPILAAYVDGLDEKEAVLAEHPDCCFTIPHFDGFRAVLILLDRVDVGLLAEIVTDAWLARAPKSLVRSYLAKNAPPG